MALYRKRPLVVEAVQLRWDTWSEVCEFLDGAPIRGGWVDPETGDFTEGDTPPPDLSLDDAQIGCILITAHGEEAIAREGDWIIPDAKPGTFYPCKPDIFERTYGLWIWTRKFLLEVRSRNYDDDRARGVIPEFTSFGEYMAANYPEIGRVVDGEYVPRSSATS